MSCTGKSREKWLAGAAVLICGLVTHGYILTNKISYHDDSVNYFGVGTTFESGRWALGLIQKFLTKIDFFNYSSSWWNGLLSILLVAVCAMILSELFQIKHTGYAVFSGGTTHFISGDDFIICLYVYSSLLYVCCIINDKCCLYDCEIFLRIFAGNNNDGILNGNLSDLFWGGNDTFCFVLVSDAETRNFTENIKEAFKYLLTLLGGILCYFLGNTICILQFSCYIIRLSGN